MHVYKASKNKYLISHSFLTFWESEQYEVYDITFHN